MQGVARHQAWVLRGIALGELHVNDVGVFFTAQADGGFLGVESEAAGGLDGLGDGEVRRPDDASGALDLAADVNVTLRHAHRDIDDVVDFLRDVGLAHALRELAGAEAAGGEGADVGQADQALLIELHGVRARIGDSLERDCEGVAGAELRVGGGEWDRGIRGLGATAAASATRRAAARDKREDEGEAGEKEARNRCHVPR